MPVNLLNQIMIVLRAAIIVIVVGWILNIPGRLQIGLFTEQMLVLVLGLSLALTFLTFPLAIPARAGEEAVAQENPDRRKAHARAGSTSCCRADASSPALRRDPLPAAHRRARGAAVVSGVLIATIIVLLVFEASRARHRPVARR